VVRRRQGRLAGQDVPDGHDLAHPGAPRLEDRGRLAVHGDHPVAGDDVLDVLVRRVGHQHARAGREAARADPCLHAVGAGVDQRLGALAGGDVAGQHLHVARGGVALEPLDHVEHEPGVAVGDVGHEDVDAGLDQGGGALPGVAEVADRRADEQAAVGVLAGVRVLLGAHEVLDGDQPGELAVGVDERQPLALVLAQDRGGVLARDADRRGDERHRRHDVGHQPGAPLGDRDEPQVAVGDHAEQGAVVVDHRQARDAVLAAQLVELLERGLGADRHGVADHARLRPLHQVDLVGLVLDRQVAVQDPQAPLARHGDGHPRLGDGVHGARQDRDAQRDLAGDPGRGVDLARDDVGLAGQQHDVVVGEAQQPERRGVGGVVRHRVDHQGTSGAGARTSGRRVLDCSGRATPARPAGRLGSAAMSQPSPEPADPFAGDPLDPARELAALDDDDAPAQEPLGPQEREDVLEDLADLEVFEALLAPRGVRGLVVECADCAAPHWFGWDLLRGNLRHLLDAGTPHVHEPAFAPDPDDYVSWDYARGFTDAALDG
jgi:hypothetical protein